MVNLLCKGPFAVTAPASHSLKDASLTKTLQLSTDVKLQEALTMSGDEDVLLSPLCARGATRVRRLVPNLDPYKYQLSCNPLTRY